MILRRIVLAACLLVLLPMRGAASAPDYAPVLPGAALHFPADHGAHPNFRNEWWYVTGWLDLPDGREAGFQVTFFRTRPGLDEGNPSAFVAKQILSAHAALSDPAVGHLLHDQRAARAGFGRAEAATGDTNIVLGDWRMTRAADGRFHIYVPASEFTLDLTFAPAQAVLEEGENGYSRKGPHPEQASYYYSLPQLTVSGAVTRGGKPMAVKGKAWLDREWSSNYLDPDAVGWDWLGLNLDDGGALMAFRIRGRDGRALWAGGSFRAADGTLTRFAPGDVDFSTVRTWHSAATGALYPVAQTLTLRAGAFTGTWRIAPVFDDQELDSRAAGGPVYWEGAVRTERGRGYLELTGYFQPLKL